MNGASARQRAVVRGNRGLLARIETLRERLLADHRRAVAPRLRELDAIRRAADALYERSLRTLPPESLPALREAHGQLSNLLAAIRRGLTARGAAPPPGGG